MRRPRARSKSQVVIAKDVRALKRIIRHPPKPVSVEHMRKAIARRAGR